MELHLGAYRRFTFGRVALLCLALGVVAACGTANDDVSASGDPASIRKEAGASFQRWAGDLAARQAAEVVVFYRLNGASAACMQKRGHSFSRWENAIASAGPDDPLADSLWLQAPESRPYSEQARLAAWSDRMERDVLHKPLDEDARADALACLDTTRSAGDDEVDAIREPASVQRLQKAWAAALRPIAERYGGPDAYLRCLDAQSIPALGGKGWRTIDEVYTKAIPEPHKIPLPGEAATEDWKAFLALEAPLTKADWRCRESQFAQAITDLPPIVAAFEAKNARDIAEASQHWVEVQRQARDLG